MSNEATYAAAAGALVQEKRLEVLSNNLANIDTIGFKADRAVFSTYLNDKLKMSVSEAKAQTSNTNTIPVSSFRQSNSQVKFEGIKTDFSAGQIKQTGNVLDVALEGKGFFCVEVENGMEQYTRKGNFKLNEDGQLVTHEGALVLGNGGKDITLGDGEITIDELGNILVDGTKCSALKIVDFSNPEQLIKTGDASFIPGAPGVKGKEADVIKVKQGFVERSNVNPIKVMTEMIEVHRAFESYQKVIRSMDDMLSKSIAEVGST